MALGPKGDVKPYDLHRVPREWWGVVCTCGPEDHGTAHDIEEKGIYMLCRKCMKLKRFYASHCSRCKNFYTMTFRHPVWSPSLNWCWDCCQWSGPYHEGVYTAFTWPAKGDAYVTVTPAWIHPTAPLTAEEITAALNFDFEIDLT